MIYSILTHLAYRANAKKRAISYDIVTVLKECGKHELAYVNLILQNDVNRCVRRCNVVFTLERRYIIM